MNELGRLPIHAFVAIALVGCDAITAPAPNTVAVESSQTSRYGFELRLPEDFVNEGWKAIALEPDQIVTDRFSSVYLRRRFILGLGAPREHGAPGSAGYGVEPTFVKWALIDSAYDVGRTIRPVMEIRVYDDVPSLTFEALVDSVRHTGFGVLDYDLNGTHVKKIEVDELRVSGFKYQHTDTSVPRIMARENGLLYAFYYDGDFILAGEVLAGFRLTER